MNVELDVGPNIASMLERLAQQIGTTADKVFPWYVQQAYLDGLFFLILLGVVFFVSVIATVYGICKGEWKHGDASNLAAVLTIMGCVGVGSSVLFGMLSGPEAATKVLNPQYHAMNMIARDIGRMTHK